MPREFYIHSIPVFVVNDVDDQFDIPEFCLEAEDLLDRGLFRNIEVMYVGDFKHLNGRSAAYGDNAIYMTSKGVNNVDMLENLVHELAHSLEGDYAHFVFDESLQNEFIGKRERLMHLLNAEGFAISPILYYNVDYNSRFDDFLANTVGYPTLLTLTMGLFASPYGATSLQEYFANGFEKYFLDSPQAVKSVSPVLHRKIVGILNGEQH